MYDQPAKDIFKVFHYIFDKEYSLNSQEALQRFTNFKETLKKIKEVNAKKLSYRFGINQFADMTVQEFKDKMGMKPEVYKAEKEKLLSQAKPAKGFLVEDDSDEVFRRNLQTPFPNVDWTYLFGPAKDQGQCGTCWDFSTVGSIEGNWNLKYPGNGPISLSNQQILDCSLPPGRNGCNGGGFTGVYDYARQYGLVTSAAYPYHAVQKNCSIPTNSTLYKVNGYQACGQGAAPCTMQQ